MIAKKLEEMAGAKPHTISRIMTRPSVPRLDTIIKLLLPLGKTLGVVPPSQTMPQGLLKRKTNNKHNIVIKCKFFHYSEKKIKIKSFFNTIKR